MAVLASVPGNARAGTGHNGHRRIRQGPLVAAGGYGSVCGIKRPPGAHMLQRRRHGQEGGGGGGESGSWRSCLISRDIMYSAPGRQRLQR
jgi:hypothetical protein